MRRNRMSHLVYSSVDFNNGVHTHEFVYIHTRNTSKTSILITARYYKTYMKVILSAIQNLRYNTSTINDSLSLDKVG